MAKVVIFGTLDIAELAHYYLTHDSEHEVVAFALTEEFIHESSFLGLPVIPFETIESYYSTDQVSLFAPMTARGMNRRRENIFLQIKNKGYSMVSYISSKATIFDNQIGENCFILENNTIQPFVSIGDNVVLWSGNHIGHHSRINNHVFFTSQVVLSGHCEVGKYSFLGVNSTIRDAVTLGEGTFVAMAAAITSNTDPWSVYKGNPAKKSSLSSDKVL